MIWQSITTELRRRPLDHIGWVLAAGAAIVAVVTTVALVVGGPAASLTPPILIESLLVLVAVEVRRRVAARAIGGLLVITIVETLRGCIVPLLVQLLGQDQPEFRRLGSVDDAVLVLFVANVFFAAVLVGYLALARLRSTHEIQRPQRIPSERTVMRTGQLAIVLGILGLLLRFPSVNALVELFGSGGSAGSSDGVLAFAGAALRPLLPLGLAVVLFLRRRSGARIVAPLAIALGLAVVLALGTYGLNRSAFIFPATAFILAAIAFSGTRPSTRVVAATATVGVAGFFAVGAIRQFFTDGSVAQATGGGPVHEALQTVLIYGQSPLQSAPVFDAQARYHYWDLSSLINSLVSPIPGVPEWIRDASGPAYYNRVLYGDWTPRDQIIPSWLESYLSAGWFGPIVLGFVAAVALYFLDRRLTTASSIVSSYAFALTIVWVAQLSINSLSTVGQGLIYFCATPAALAAGLWVAHRRNRTNEPVDAVVTE